MALTITEFLRAVMPNIGLVVNADGSYRIGVEDINSDEALAALQAILVAVGVGGAVTIADGADVAQGAIADAVVAAGAAGTVSAKLRRLTEDLNNLAPNTGAIADAVVAAGAVGTLSAKLRRLTTDLDALNTLIGATDAAVVAAGAVGSISAKLRRATQGLEDLKTLVVLAAGANIIGQVGIDQTTPGTTNNVVRGSNALSNSGVLSADTGVKGSAGLVYWLSVSDTAALAIEINDSVAGAGTDVWAVDLPADGYGHFIFDPPIVCGTGIYLDVSTATCKVTIGYK